MVYFIVCALCSSNFYLILASTPRLQLACWPSPSVTTLKKATINLHFTSQKGTNCTIKAVPGEGCHKSALIKLNYHLRKLSTAVSSGLEKPSLPPMSFTSYVLSPPTPPPLLIHCIAGINGSSFNHALSLSIHLSSSSFNTHRECVWGASSRLSAGFSDVINPHLSGCISWKNFAQKQYHLLHGGECCRFVLIFPPSFSYTLPYSVRYCRCLIKSHNWPSEFYRPLKLN